jgi:hypothetical protein
MRPQTLTFTATAAGQSQWVPVDAYVPNAVHGVQLTSTGVAATVQGTYNNPFATTTPAAFTVSTSLAAVTGVSQAAVTLPVRAFRIDASGAGTFVLDLTQQGLS